MEPNPFIALFLALEVDAISACLAGGVETRARKAENHVALKFHRSLAKHSCLKALQCISRGVG